MKVLDLLRQEAKQDSGLYALITAFGIQSIDIKEPYLVKFIENLTGENPDKETFKQTLIREIKNPENDTYFRTLGLQDYHINLHTRANGGAGLDNSDDLLDSYDSYVDFVNDNEHMKRM